MKQIIFDKKKLECYKDFYVQVYNDLDGKGFMDWEDYENLNYNPNMLDEFLWYNNNKNIEFIFINFDIEKIKLEKTYDDYEWKIIFEVVSDFVKEYPNNIMKIIKKKKVVRIV